MSERKYIPHPSHGELFYPDQTPFNLAGELLDNSTTSEGEARVRALAEAEARKAQRTFYDSTCERCGELHYSSLPHCAKCHRELWTPEPAKRRPHEARGSAASNACFGAY